MSNVFGEHLKELRLKRRLTMRDVETATGLSNAYISLLEKGKRTRPTGQVIRKLAEVYQVEMSDLMYALPDKDGGGKKNPPKPSPSESHIIERYRNLNPKNRELMGEFLDVLNKWQK